MTTRRMNLMLISAALTVLQLGGGNVCAGEQVERPFKIQGSSTMVVNLADGSYVAEGRGAATHCGRVSVAGWGVMGVGGSGSATAANGDQLSFDEVGNGVMFSGGTGRFLGATGGFTFMAEIISVVDDPVANTRTIRYRWKGSGTIKY